MLYEQKVLKKRDIKCDWIRSRQYEKKDSHHWDYIICMDEDNVRGVHRIGGLCVIILLLPSAVEEQRLIE